MARTGSAVDMEATGAGTKSAVNVETLYTKQNCIGGGSFGKVYKGVDRRTGETVAIKVVEIEAANDDVRDIIEEISILAGLHSPYVTKYHGSYLNGADLWIIMEYCGGGSCADLIESGTMSEEYISIVMKELLMGLDYLHSDKKMHRDIKAANILLGTNGQVKLADFGVSGQLTATMTKKNTFVGTPFWMAPEVIKQSGYNYSADIWSLGITAMELAQGKPPHYEIHPMKVLFIIPKQAPPVLEGHFSPLFKDFVALCLRKDPKERPTAKELLRHPFVRKAGKPVFLTELIERHERWQTQYRHHHVGGEDSDDEDRPRQQHSKEEEEDLWDFGTVKPAQRGGGGGGLRVMNDAGMNARSTVTRSPSPTKQARDFQPQKQRTPPQAPYHNLQTRPVIPSPTRLSQGSRHSSIGLSPKAAARHLPPPSAPLQAQKATPAPSNLARKPVPPPLRMPSGPQQSQTAARIELEQKMESLDISAEATSAIGAVQRPKPVHSTSAWSPYSAQPPTRPSPHQRTDTAIHQSQLPRLQRLPSTGSISSAPLVRTPSSASQRFFPIPPSTAVSQPPTPGLQQQQQYAAFQQPYRQQMPLGNGPSQIPQPVSYSPRSTSGNTLASSSSTASFSSVSSSTTTSPLYQPAPETPVSQGSAITSVIVPALQAAVNRRQAQLSRLHRQSAILSMSSTSSSGDNFATDILEQKRKEMESQEHIRKLVSQAKRLFDTIDKWDAMAPVGMGDGVETFLEGWLDEVLRRCEVDEEVDLVPSSR